MCNACGFYCCADDSFERCGCECPASTACYACFNCGSGYCDGECTEDDLDLELIEEES